MARVTLSKYVGGSCIAAALVTYHAFSTREQYAGVGLDAQKLGLICAAAALPASGADAQLAAGSFLPLCTLPLPRWPWLF